VTSRKAVHNIITSEMIRKVDVSDINSEVTSTQKHDVKTNRRMEHDR